MRLAARIVAGGLIAVLSACSSTQTSVYAERVTLDAGDPLRSSWCFGSGEYGRVLQDGEVRNRGTQAEFGLTGPGELSVVGSGGEDGVIVDLGVQKTADDAFALLTRDSAAVASLPVFDRGSHESTPVHATDLCVIRIAKLATAIGPHAEGSTAWIKLQVLEVEPSGRLTFRWALL